MHADYFLKSARLGFRCWKDDDLPLAMELWGDADVTGLIGGPFTREMVRDRLNREIAQRRECGLQYWPVFLLDSDQHIGCAGLRPYRSERKVYEFGVHLRHIFWGQGLAKEASLAVIDYAFGELGSEALFAGHHAENEASKRLLLRLGFAYTHDEFYSPTRLMHPSYLLPKA